MEEEINNLLSENIDSKNLAKEASVTDLLAVIASLFERVSTLQGIQGEKGEVGEQGDKGDDGVHGLKAKDGINGTDGIDGVDGLDGKDGEKGEDGVGGADVSPIVVEKLQDEIEELKKKLESVRIAGASRAMGASVQRRFLNNITPVGAIDGSNATYTLPKAPTTDSEKIFHNGVRMRSGSSNDYTISAKTITFNTAPLTADILLIDFEY